MIQSTLQVRITMLNSNLHMGRRKLYLTTEAKRDANCAKSRRSYEKYYLPFLPVERPLDIFFGHSIRHQIATNERRRERYQPKEK
jgi:hypothetical protein